MKNYNYKILQAITILIFSFAGCSTHGPLNPDDLNKNPNLPANPNPPDNSVNIPRFVTLEWTCTDPENDPLTYDVYMDYSDPPQSIVTEGITVNSYATGLLQPNARVYWKIIAKDDHNGTTNGNVWLFTTSN